jgi:hypothetical protein
VQPRSTAYDSVSQREGRFIASPDVLQRLIDNGQIATQYADNSGEPSMHISVNPNGSVCAVEGILQSRRQSGSEKWGIRNGTVNMWRRTYLEIFISLILKAGSLFQVNAGSAKA